MEINIDEMTRQEKSLLLFLECCYVDYGGLVNTVHMSEEDMSKAKEWNEIGFVEFGRIKSDDITRSTHWCRLNDYAMSLAAVARKDRAERLWLNRNWSKSTGE